MIRVIAGFILCAVIIRPSFAMGSGYKREAQKPLSVNVHFGSDKNDIGNDIIYLNDGVYIAGVTLGELPGCKTSGKWDAFLIRYDADGNMVWCRQWGTPGRDSAEGISADSTGLYVTGFAEGPMYGGQDNGGFDIFLSKFDFNGNMIWTKQWGTEEEDKGRAVYTAASNVYVTGFTRGALDGNSHSGKADIFLSCFGTEGEKKWTLLKGTEESEWGNRIAADETGLYVTGFSMGALAGKKAFGYDDIVLVKYSFDGKEQWARQWGTPYNDEGNGVIAVSGNIYVAGRTGGNLDGKRHYKYDDGFLSMYTAGGDKGWTVIIGTVGKDTATGIAAGNSILYVAGFTNGNLGEMGKQGYLDAFLAEYSTEGKKLVIRQYGTGGFDFSGSVCTAEDGIYMTGDSSFTVSGEQNLRGNRDLILLKWRE